MPAANLDENAVTRQLDYRNLRIWFAPVDGTGDLVRSTGLIKAYGGQFAAPDDAGVEANKVRALQ